MGRGSFGYFHTTGRYMPLTRERRGRTISSMLNLQKFFKAKSKKDKNSLRETLPLGGSTFLREVKELRESIRLGQRLVLMSR